MKQKKKMFCSGHLNLHIVSGNIQAKHFLFVVMYLLLECRHVAVNSSNCLLVLQTHINNLVPLIHVSNSMVIIHPPGHHMRVQ